MNRYLSELDQKRFGVITVKAEGLESIEDLEECISFSNNNKADLLIARLDASKINVVHQLETLGSILCDTLIYYELRCLRVKNSIPTAHTDEEPFRLREVMARDQVAVTDVAREAFSEYVGPDQPTTETPRCASFPSCRSDSPKAVPFLKNNRAELRRRLLVSRPR